MPHSRFVFFHHQHLKSHHQLIRWREFLDAMLMAYNKAYVEIVWGHMVEEWWSRPGCNRIKIIKCAVNLNWLLLFLTVKIICCARNICCYRSKNYANWKRKYIMNSIITPDRGFTRGYGWYKADLIYRIYF